LGRTHVELQEGMDFYVIGSLASQRDKFSTGLKCVRQLPNL